jgi:hypothetical protein
MSFTRTKTDTCNYKQELEGNVSYISYLLDPVKFDHCDKCRMQVGTVGGTNSSHIRGNLVDLESNLFGIDRDASRCPVTRYIPPADNKLKGSCFIKPVERPVIDTRLVHLNGCQLIDYSPSTPYPPPMDRFRCGSK